ncbi:proline-rich protein HaeIII subfamily 1-like isoform X1 [Gadus macrocephalus]|uniref:proline-rich protein HaeIII subfamily 1-like isoform X1 n=2 Tax=Gadus macrocephalus TaxID=80720 RepID=UPI0028CB619A|nr:proline-rich protein HaeIII subfamily 1-like isoform X1 [Gadus macrocephalus]
MCVFLFVCVPSSEQTSDASLDEEVLNVKRPNRRTSYRVQLVPSLACQTVGPNNVGSVLEPEPQPRPLVSMTQTDPASSPSRNTQRPSEDSATLRPNPVVLKARQPSGGKTPRIKSSGEKTPGFNPRGRRSPRPSPQELQGPPRRSPLGPQGPPRPSPLGPQGPARPSPRGPQGPPRPSSRGPQGPPRSSPWGPQGPPRPSPQRSQGLA